MARRLLECSIHGLRQLSQRAVALDVQFLVDSRRWRRASRGLQGVCIPWGRPGIKWESIGSKQDLVVILVNADNERKIDSQWTHIRRALSSRQACRQKPHKPTCAMAGLPERAPTLQARDDPPGNRGSTAYQRHGEARHNAG